VALLRRVALGEIDAAIDAEVLQKILHRYRAIRRWQEGKEGSALTRRIAPVVAITDALVDRARDLLDGDPRLGARDALHAAVVLERGIAGLCSYDRDLDGIARPGPIRTRRALGASRALCPADDEGPVPFGTGPPSGESALIRTSRTGSAPASASAAAEASSEARSGPSTTAIERSPRGDAVAAAPWRPLCQPRVKLS
jgi:predicted nucleic acid-binding protein